jgi:hypothetical protein
VGWPSNRWDSATPPLARGLLRKCLWAHRLRCYTPAALPRLFPTTWNATLGSAPRCYSCYCCYSSATIIAASAATANSHRAAGI